MNTFFTSIVAMALMCFASPAFAKGNAPSVAVEPPQQAEEPQKVEEEPQDIKPEKGVPSFARYKHELPELMLKHKREKRYMTPMPIIAIDPDTGVNLGAMINFYDNGPKEDPFFKIAPYRQMIAASALITSKEVFQLGVYFDQPYIFDSPWRVRSEVELLHNPIQNYFGIGSNGQLLTSPFNGQVYGSYNAYKENLNQVVNGQTYSHYDEYKLSRLAFQAFAEYDLVGGLIRPLFGFRVAKVWIGDYTGTTGGGVLQLPTHLRSDCNAGLATGCTGGYDNYVKFGISFDTRDFEPDPSKGIFFETASELSPKFLGSAFNYGRLTSALNGYGEVLQYKKQNVVLAGRFLYSWQFGDVPFYSMDTLALTDRDRFGLGGLRTLRGFRQDRFIGPVSLLANAELRWSFAEFNVFKQHIKLAMAPFVDTGRVFNDNSSMTFQNWKIDGGAGLRLAWNLSTVVIFDYGFAPEGQAFYMDLQYQF